MSEGKIVKFNVGGTRYEVARSLLASHPDTMLARMTSDQWQKDHDSEIFIERDGLHFRYCLSYLHVMAGCCCQSQSLERPFLRI
mmetsp:Transcript_6752/g.13163  ORF Transcript_6752/g.13163 Transcript_6752/m.13163 type:complete len:84 (+) Transcript_6752:685-936(+)